MRYKFIQIDSLVKKITNKVFLFSGNYTVDSYQNCEFGCRYCDSSFDETIYIKTNAAEILDEELKNLPKGRVIIGSVHDPYQKIEENQKITREILNVLLEHDFTCHILTKSDLVLRDLDLLKKLDKPIVTVSISSVNKKICQLFENNIADVTIRLGIVEKLKSNGIKTGVALLPMMPFFVENELEEIIKNVKQSNADYLLFKHLELKGDQKNYFFNIVEKNFPELLCDYERLYFESFKPSDEYIQEINDKIRLLSRKYKLVNKIEI